MIHLLNFLMKSVLKMKEESGMDAPESKTLHPRQKKIHPFGSV